MAKKPTVFNRKKALRATTLASQGKLTELSAYLQETIDTAPADSAWVAAFVKFNKWLENPSVNKLPYKIFAKGNGKLPFWAFSASPLVTCPGKGECAKWCYSLKAWRYPAPLLRQIMNTILVKYHSSIIADAFLTLKENVDVRLYVDGDIDSVETLVFWMDLLKKREDVKVYGYSKSWSIFLAYNLLHTFPTNYQLNLSSGSKYANNSGIYNAMKALPISRGDFVAVSIDEKNPSRKTIKEVAKSFGMTKIFVCPSKCGACIPSKSNGKKNIHACGAPEMKGRTIVIPTH